MVLTNFECWSHSGSDNNLSVSSGGNSIDLFNQCSVSANSPSEVNDAFNGNLHSNQKQNNVSHLSSNGYYGFVARNYDTNAAAMMASAGNPVLRKSHVSNSVHQQQQETRIVPVEIEENMDIEQHFTNETRTNFCASINSINMPSSDHDLLLSAQQNNGRLDRRKRLFTGVDVVPVNAKRCRIDVDDRFVLHNGDLAKRFAAETEFIAMDHGDNMLTDNNNQLVLEKFSPCENNNSINNYHHQSQNSFNQTEMTAIENQIGVDTQLKSNTNRTAKLRIHRNSSSTRIKNITKKISVDCFHEQNNLIDGKREKNFISNIETNNASNKTNGDDSINETYPYSSSIKNNLKLLINRINNKRNCNDCEQLECLYVSLHGGNRCHMFKHFFNYETEDVEL